MKRIAGLVFLVLGLVTFVLVRRNLQQGSATTTWPAVDGTVVRSEQIQRSRGDGKSSGPWAEINYTYRVGEVEYRGDQVNVGNLRGSGDVGPLLERYPKGKQVPVHYNPDDPSEAVLEPGVPARGRWLYAVPAVFGILGVIRLLTPARAKP